MVGRKFEVSPPQPIDDCLAALGKFLCGGPGVTAMMVRHDFPPLNPWNKNPKS